MVGRVQWSDHPGRAVLPNKSLFWKMKDCSLWQKSRSDPLVKVPEAVL